MDIPLPSFLKNENNQVFVLVGFFFTFIMLPVVIILRLKDGNDPTDLKYDNGILKQSSATMLAMLKEVLEKNMRKKQKTISED